MGELPRLALTVLVMAQRMGMNRAKVYTSCIMQNGLLSILCALPLLITRSDAQHVDPATESALIAAEIEVGKALQVRDESTLRKRLAEDFLMVHTTGAARDTRDRFIHSIVKYGRRVRDAQITTYDREVRLLSPGLALVLSTVEERTGDQSRWLTRTSIWRNTSGYWQAIYGHGALIGVGKAQTSGSLAAYQALTGRYKTSDGRAFVVSINASRLMIAGPRQIERHDVLIPQGGLEFLASGYRLEFFTDTEPVTAKAIDNGNVVWTAQKIASQQPET